MPIISISLNNEILTEMDSYQAKMGFSGRSEIIRAGIRALILDEKQKSRRDWNGNAILLVLHDDDFDSMASELSHGYEDMIITRTHSKIEEKRCMELFVLKGDTKRISDMEKRYQTNKNMNTVKMIVF